MLKNQISKAAILLKSIGHPIRVSIIISLSQNSVMTVSQLSDHLDVDQPVMSLHLAILRNLKIIQVQKKGKQSLYSIKETSIKQAVNIVYHSIK